MFISHGKMQSATNKWSYRERVIDAQGNLACKKQIVLFPVPADSHQTRHVFAQICLLVCGHNHNITSAMSLNTDHFSMSFPYLYGLPHFR